MKTLKRNEYSVSEQLKKLPTQIYILSLLLSSEEHQDSLLKILIEPHVQRGIVMKDLKHIVGQFIARNTITFTKDKLINEGPGHIKSLHIAIECHGIIISKVLIDNWCALNIFPTMTLQRIGVDDTFICGNATMVRAFGGSK